MDFTAGAWLDAVSSGFGELWSGSGVSDGGGEELFENMAGDFVGDLW